MLRKLAVVAAVASVSISCADTPTTPPTGPQFATTVAKAPISGFITNPCNGETIVYSGTVHQSIQTKTKGSVTTLRIFATGSSITGVGLTTGTRYVVVEGLEQTMETDVAPPFPTEFEFVVRDRWQSQGGQDNFWQMQHYTVTFDGVNTTTAVKKMETDCKG